MSERPLPRTGSSSGPMMPPGDPRGGPHEDIDRAIESFKAEGLKAEEKAHKLIELERAKEAYKQQVEMAAHIVGGRVPVVGHGEAKPEPEEPGKNYPLQSPAITINAILGLLLAGATLFGLTLTEEQTTALTVIVSGLFLIGPVIAGFVIKAINSRGA